MALSRFSRSVFVNCPFDKKYIPLRQALLFALLDCGLEPRLASERSDAGEVRVTKILSLIRASRYSIHDLSRMEPLRRRDLPRFNMPFELGVDLGSRYFGRAPLSGKRCLVLEKEPYRYQKVLSDISGQDIRPHGEQPEELVRVVRNWLYVTTRRALPGPTQIWKRFNIFLSHLQLSLKSESHFSLRDIRSLEVAEYIYNARTWIRDNPLG